MLFQDPGPGHFVLMPRGLMQEITIAGYTNSFSNPLPNSKSINATAIVSSSSMISRTIMEHPAGRMIDGNKRS